jgi:serine/threonine-protein kinase HipA
MAASVLISGSPVGLLHSEGGTLGFRYHHRGDADPKPTLSVRMPYREGIYEECVAGPYFDGLLPEARRAREALARRLDIAAEDDYALLLSLGAELPWNWISPQNHNPVAQAA